MSVILSMETFNRLEEKLGTEAAKEVYQLAEAIYEEIDKKTNEKLKNYKLDFADDEYKRLTRKEINEFKEELKERQLQAKNEYLAEVKNSIRSLSVTIKIALALSLVNLAGLVWIINSLVSG